MLTSRPAQGAWWWPTACTGAAMILWLAALTSARAGGVVNLNCIGGKTSFNCAAQWATPGDPYVRTVPEALGETEKAQIAARERKWLARCRPVVEHDIYGVARYQYAAPGCEYGVGTD